MDNARVEIRHAFLVSHSDAGLGSAHVRRQRVQLRIVRERETQQIIGIRIFTARFKRRRRGRIGLFGRQAQRGLEILQLRTARICQIGQVIVNAVEFVLSAQSFR